MNPPPGAKKAEGGIRHPQPGHRSFREVPATVVHRKDGSTRICVDYRSLPAEVGGKTGASGKRASAKKHNTAGKGFRGGVFCYYCGREGHVNQHCQVRRCTHCRAIGHHVSNCPHRMTYGPPTPPTSPQVHPDVLHVPAELPFPFNFIEVEVVGPVCDQRHLNGSRYVVAISDCHTRYVQATLFQVPAIPQVATVLCQEVLRRYDLLTALERTEQEWVRRTVEYKLREILEQGVRAQLHRSDLPQTTAASSHRHSPTSQPRSDTRNQRNRISSSGKAKQRSRSPCRYCYRCGRPGHIQSDCPQCRTCGKAGHRSRDCKGSRGGGTPLSPQAASAATPEPLVPKNPFRNPPPVFSGPRGLAKDTCINCCLPGHHVSRCGYRLRPACRNILEESSDEEQVEQSSSEEPKQPGPVSGPVC